MTLPRVLWHLLCTWWWGLAVGHVAPDHPDLPYLSDRRKRHADRVRQFINEGSCS
jgi:hypothetical protein